MATITSSFAVRCLMGKLHSHSFDTGPSFKLELQHQPSRPVGDHHARVQGKFGMGSDRAGDSEISPAVKQLLSELSARGIPIHDSDPVSANDKRT